jgi:putative transposase
MKSARQRLLDTERNVHLGRTETPALLDPPAEPPSPDRPRNRRNGDSQKTVPGALGEFSLDMPRDRNGIFEPQRLGK